MVATSLFAHFLCFGARFSWDTFLLYNSLKGLNLKSESDDFLAPKHWASLSISQGPNYPTYLRNGPGCKGKPQQIKTSSRHDSRNVSLVGIS